MKTDAKIKEHVIDQLIWEPNIDEKQIGVAVEDGVVTLTGVVDNYTKKRAAENAAKKVSGVKAVAEEIEVKFGEAYKKTDTEIAKAAVDILEWNVSVPSDKILVNVEDGWIYLTGEVEWAYQREAAKKALQNLPGVKYVVDRISLKQKAEPKDIKSKITKAFERAADVDAKQIEVEVDGHTVILRGTVSSLSEKDNARKTAYASPGVYNVINELKIEFYHDYA